MKVVFATGIFPPDVGGPATFVPAAASAWMSRGWQVEVVTYSDSVKDADVSDGTSFPYPIRRVLRRLPLLKRYVAYFRLLWRASGDANVIFAQDPVAAGAPAFLVAWLRRKRFVLKLVGDFAWEHATVQEGYAGTIDAFQKDEAVSIRIKLMRFIQKYVAYQADRVIVPSRYLARIAEGWGVASARIEVIHNGVEEIVPPSVGIRKTHRIVTSARLVAWKGIDTLIVALSEVRVRVPDATLCIIGDGPDGDRLKRLVHAAHLEAAVMFVGRKTREGVAAMIAESDVFALVSSYEGFSHQLAEAFRLGAAIVASDAGGNSEIVTDGQDGLLVKYGDAVGTAAALTRLLLDPALGARLGEAAKQRGAAFDVVSQLERTAVSVQGADGLRVLLISRDASLLDPSSRGAARMRLYGERAESLRIVALAKRDGTAELSPRVHARLTNVRGFGMTLMPAIDAATDEAVASHATLVVAQDPFEAGIVGWSVSKRLKLPLVIEEHGGVYLGPFWKMESLKNRLMHHVGLHVLAAANGFRAVSAKIERNLRARFPAKPIARIPVFTEPLACGTGHKRFTFGYVGRLVHQKNLPMLLEAFRHVVEMMPEARLALVGGGPLEAELRTLSTSLGLADHVEWLPFREDISDAYATIETLVLSSWYEGWGRVVVEAMHCGIPVVMTDVGAAGEVVVDGAEGRVVSIGDAVAFAEAMRTVADPIRHAAMAEAALKRSAKIESPEALADRLAAFWKGIVGL